MQISSQFFDLRRWCWNADVLRDWYCTIWNIHNISEECSTNFNVFVALEALWVDGFKHWWQPSTHQKLQESSSHHVKSMGLAIRIAVNHLRVFFGIGEFRQQVPGKCSYFLHHQKLTSLMQDDDPSISGTQTKYLDWLNANFKLHLRLKPDSGWSLLMSQWVTTPFLIKDNQISCNLPSGPRV